MTASDIVVDHNLLVSPIVNCTQCMKSSLSNRPLSKSNTDLVQIFE
jgi:hypothetical protein